MGGGDNRIMFVSTPTIFWYHVYSSFDLIFQCINKHTPPYQQSVSLCCSLLASVVVVRELANDFV